MYKAAFISGQKTILNMEEKASVNNQPRRSIQDYLSLGYIYLLLLGITTDSIYFGFLGINILEYSTIVDVILSPIIYLTKSLAFPLVIFLTPALGLILMTFKNRGKVKKEAGRTEAVHWTKQKVSFTPNKGMILFVAVTIFSAYLGYGLGGGKKMQGRLEEGSLKLNYQLTFNDGEQLPVHLIDHNSLYVFYVTENSKSVTVSPVEGNIKKIEKLEK
jgi:hypothetical protein